MNHKLTIALSYRGSVLERLRREFPDADEETLLDTVEGLTDLDDVIAEIVRSRLEDLAMIEALQQRRDAMSERLSRLKDRADRKKELVTDAMEQAGLKSLVREDFTLSLRLGRAGLQILDERVIPKYFWRPQPPQLDRQSVLLELKRGADVPGVCLSNPVPTISVRTK